MYPPPRASKITGGFPCGKAYVRPSPSLALRRFFMDAPRRPSPSGRTRAPRSEREPGSWAAPSWAGSSAGSEARAPAGSPAAVLVPGETVNIDLTYAVLTPSADQQVLVRETREILVNGTSVGKTEIKIEREGGTWKSIVPIILPADAPAGKYRVIASVESAGGGKDVEETNFKVQR